jgi:hypothetical protein
MIKIILEFLPYLALGVVANIILGTYNSVFKLHKDFEWSKLFIGLWKAFVVSTGFISSAILWDKLFGVVNLGKLEVSPDILILSVITMYLAKIILQLKDIFLVEDFVEYADYVDDNYFDEVDIDEELEDVVIDR